MKITIVGAGYVGLVASACFCEFGYEVTCIDRSVEKIARLNGGQVPVHEPGLDELLDKARDEGRLEFTTKFETAIAGADVVFICVGTPSARGKGFADMSFVLDAVKSVAENLAGFTVIVTKSTVPVGTAKALKKVIGESCGQADFEIASNPEFLREGSAVKDFLHPDRIVIGTDSKRAKDMLCRLYQPLAQRNIAIVTTDLESAEVIKYASNAYLATRIGFINELADFCQAAGGNIQTIVDALGLDHRIGPYHLQPGPGFGGSCFPKDTRALAEFARDNQTPMTIVEAVISSNEARKRSLAGRVVAGLGGSVEGKKIGVLGVAFKAGTDDTREAASINLIEDLQNFGAEIVACDVVAQEAGEQVFENVSWFSDPYLLAENCDCLVVMTEWNGFRGLEMSRLAGVMKQPVMFDFRNIYDVDDMAKSSFVYHSIGRSVVGKTD